MPFSSGPLRVFTIGAAVLVSTYAISSFGQASGHMTGIKFVAEVPLLDCDGTPCVDARIGDGEIIRMGIDTGNVDSIVDSKVADAAGLRPSEPPKPGAPSGMFRTMMPSVHIGELSLTKVPAMGMDLSVSYTHLPVPS